ncbi:hypothetical protein COU17_01205 [Candidatus Kaiserbacteria bacterium CG10_big_fil_rev_8_21_14_0_10_49_17]|uniref:Uncharacterized protein n=1 Tax=Candidatus Kaiserbacteria bacterium CG10_big_fil_rev_8_21_14_0_10_49_17 TaxID=1974609 RepID=A0A2M6WEK6_9BACT|nr:MAG: hypothetical protein COU17_01205 [Candidatus Kaiserbacteria bacterium CG10_big_fil_rev_8_21_14_0_10_49_17]
MPATPPTDLGELMELISQTFLFDGKKYPELRPASLAKRYRFAVRHSALHISKSAGAIAAEAEKADHGEQMDHQAIKLATAKLFVTTVNLACHSGMTANDLSEMVPKIVK